MREARAILSEIRQLPRWSWATFLGLLVCGSSSAFGAGLREPPTIPIEPGGPFGGGPNLYSHHIPGGGSDDTVWLYFLPIFMLGAMWLAGFIFVGLPSYLFDHGSRVAKFFGLLLAAPLILLVIFLIVGNIWKLGVEVGWIYVLIIIGASVWWIGAWVWPTLPRKNSGREKKEKEGKDEYLMARCRLT